MGIKVHIGSVRRTKAETLARWRDIRQEWQRQLTDYAQEPNPPSWTEPDRCPHGLMTGLYCTMCAALVAPDADRRRGHRFEIQAGLRVRVVRMKREHSLRLDLQPFWPPRYLTKRGFQGGVFYAGDHEISMFDNHLRMYEEQTGWYVRSGKNVGIAIRSQRPTKTPGFLWDGDARFRVEQSLTECQCQMPHPWTYGEQDDEDIELYRVRWFSRVIVPCLDRYTGLIEIAKPASYAQWRDLSERQPSKRKRRKSKRDISGWDTPGTLLRGSSGPWPFMPGPEACTDKQIEKWRARDWKKHKPFDEHRQSWTVKTPGYSVTLIHCRPAPSISERGLKDLNAILKIENYGWQPEAELPQQIIPPRYNPARMVQAIRKRWHRQVWSNGGVRPARPMPQGSTGSTPMQDTRLPVRLAPFDRGPKAAYVPREVRSVSIPVASFYGPPLPACDCEQCQAEKAVLFLSCTPAT